MISGRAMITVLPVSTARKVPSEVLTSTVYLYDAPFIHVDFCPHGIQLRAEYINKS